MRYWGLADDEGWRFFRVADDNLALELVTTAKSRALPIGCLSFDYTAYRDGGGLRLADLEEFTGTSGWLKVSKLVVRTAGQIVEHILPAAVADDGRPLVPVAVSFNPPVSAARRSRIRALAVPQIRRFLHRRDRIRGRSRGY
jgi:hypothetical protein